MIIKKYAIPIEENFSFLNNYGYDFHGVLNLNRILRVYYLNVESSNLIRIEYSYANRTLMIDLYEDCKDFRPCDEEKIPRSIGLLEVMKQVNGGFDLTAFNDLMPQKIGYDESCKQLAKILSNYFSKQG